ncbi:MAG: hypothetical protein CVU84_14160 [Firmicutes bacterium HGW-Firmicutes-1]|jgi:glycosyltransferase involved in cell wall biosynthesis|nr:MAG: hypothetical protein CVU84_14160 [Firmicutes bacterium HGW-Firmicutes-1]
MKKIAIVDTSDFNTYPVGGQLTSIQSFIKYIALERSHEIELILIGITRNENEVDQQLVRVIGGKKYQFIPIYCDKNDPQSPKVSLRKCFFKALMKHRKVIRGLKLDMVYIHTPEAFLPVKLANKKLEIVTFSHGNYYALFDKIRFSKYKNVMIKFVVNCYITFLIKHSNQVFVLDTTTYTDYKKYNKNVEKVMNSIDLEQFKRSKPIQTEHIQGVYVGRLSQNKNIDKIIMAYKDLPLQHKLKIIGNGEMHEALSNLIKEHHLEEQVVLIGSKTQEELPKYYHDANLLIMNSDVEGLPMVILEALSSGLPIVTTPVGAIPEMIQDGIHGRFTNGTSNDIRMKMLELLPDIKRISTSNTKYAKQFGYQTVNKEICNILLKVQ